MVKKTHFLITALIFTSTIAGSAFIFMTPVSVTESSTEIIAPKQTVIKREGKYIVAHLDTMILDLKDGTTTLETLPLLSQGKPGSYYETIGGVYTSDYKVPLHFSSIGHVYMPYSVHIFGNYFIHGIPYYPNGNPVSSTYSGGCIRMTNENAKKVYNFVQEGTPIIVTRDGEHSFDQTPITVSSSLYPSMTLTNFMIATISLEALTQDNQILDTDSVATTTRKTTLSRLLVHGDTAVAHLYAKHTTEKQFVDLMNQKATSLGLTNTHFNNLTSPAMTSNEDQERFMEYIDIYKSYIHTIQ